MISNCFLKQLEAPIYKHWLSMKNNNQSVASWRINMIRCGLHGLYHNLINWTRSDANRCWSKPKVNLSLHFLGLVGIFLKPLSVNLSMAGRHCEGLNDEQIDSHSQWGRISFFIFHWVVRLLDSTTCTVMAIGTVIPVPIPDSLMSIFLQKRLKESMKLQRYNLVNRT